MGRWARVAVSKWAKRRAGSCNCNLATCGRGVDLIAVSKISLIK